MEEQRVCQAKIVEALEAEKKKISKELEEMQNRRAQRENRPPRNGDHFLSIFFFFQNWLLAFLIRF